jgi:cAMP-dependent protein kinase regulator
MADLRKLKNEALEAAAKGNWRKAAWCYANLEKNEPTDPSWALKLGESLRRLGNHAEAIKALGRAVNAYAKGGIWLKAVAVCKIILSMDPGQARAQELLDGFFAAERESAEAPPMVPSRRVAAPAAATQEPSSAAPPLSLFPAPEVFPSSSAELVPRSGPSLSPPPPLSQLRLAALVPGARPSEQVPASGSSAAMEIPLDDASDDFVAEVSHPLKGAGRATMARFVLPKTPFFSVLTRAQLQTFVERVRLVHLRAGEVLFSRGDAGDALYVVAWGEVSVVADRELARLAEGEFFGEISLFADRPRTATVRATVDSHVLAIDRALLADLVSGAPEMLKIILRFLRERLVVTLAETSPLFAPFTPLERLGLAARFQFLEVDEGLCMVEQGNKSPGLFVLLSGEAEAVASGAGVARLESGDAFGEISLLTGQAATASVVARSKNFLLFLPRSDFSEIIMTHPQVLEHLSTIAEARLRAIGRIDLF